LAVVMRGHDLRLRDAPRDIVNERQKPPVKSGFVVRSERFRPSSTTYVPLARPQPLHVSRLDAFACRHRSALPSRTA
jgi:hypothetical protein